MMLLRPCNYKGLHDEDSHTPQWSNSEGQALLIPNISNIPSAMVLAECSHQTMTNHSRHRRRV